MDNPSILIIDDDPSLRKTLSDILRVKGYETVEASDGAEGLSLLKRCKANVVLIDLGLPDMPGIELLGRIKADHPHIEAIILTGNATLDSAIEATNSGAFSFLLKPYDIEQLLLHIRRAVDKQQTEEKFMEHSRKLEKINEELKALYDVTRAVSKTIDMDELLSEILQVLSKLEIFRIVFKGALFIVEGKKLRLVSSLNFPEVALEHCNSIPNGECLCGMAESTGNIIFSANTVNNSPDIYCNPDNETFGQIIIPLKSTDKIVGVLSLYYKLDNRIDEQVRDVLSSMGSQIGFAVENAKLYEETRNSSLHDPLTGLANRRALELQMEKGFEIAKRYAESFSVVMADIDHFKRFNDAHGHQEGDKLLIRVAEILEKDTRSSDCVFRYGGEEFLIILTKTDMDKACMVAEKIRADVEAKAGITISLGVATYDESMASSEELVRMADAALYRAKEKGRNRVEVG
jgi:diguanylate cyclase (GGDEF)-like protein